jgi:hypothetical protein
MFTYNCDEILITSALAFAIGKVSETTSELEKTNSPP